MYMRMFQILLILLKELKNSLKDEGVVTIEFPHFLNLLKKICLIQFIMNITLIFPYIV